MPRNKKNKHAIQGRNDVTASTHKNNLSKTCSASGCHKFSSKAVNTGFVNTDMHDIGYIPVYERMIASQLFNLDTGWKRFLVFVVPVILILAVGSLLWSLFAKNKKSVVFSLFGGDRFQQIMIGRKPKAKVKKTKAVNKKKPQKPAAGEDK